MPELANRKRDEASIAGSAYVLFLRTRQDVTSAVFDPTEFADAFHHFLAPKLEAVHDKAYTQLLREYDVEARPQVLSRRFADRVAKNLGSDVAAGLAERIEQATQQQQQGGEDFVHPAHYLADLAKEQLDRVRARTIAITEVTRAVSAGEFDAVAQIKKQTGLVLKARWFTSREPNVCPICLPYEGRLKNIWGTRFPFGPPAHPSCNCWLDWTE
jgi:hypothetical protein